MDLSYLGYSAAFLVFAAGALALHLLQSHARLVTWVLSAIVALMLVVAMAEAGAQMPEALSSEDPSSLPLGN